jgi:two-component system sensor histidine kinase HydH
MDSELTTTPATVTIHGEPHDVCIDDPAMQQVLLNLLLNARDVALEADDPALVLDLDYGVDSVTLSVKDHGAGLGGRDPEQLFAPFETTKEKGSGLGLAVVRQVAEDHGGSVHISDRADGPGAVATVVLPYAGPNQED